MKGHAEAHPAWNTGRLELARRMVEEARDLVDRIGLGALREKVEALQRELGM